MPSLGRFLSYSNLHLSHISLVTCFFSWPNAHSLSPIMDASSSLCLLLFPSLVSPETPLTHPQVLPLIDQLPRGTRFVQQKLVYVRIRLSWGNPPDLGVQNLTFESPAAPDQPQHLWILPNHTRFLIQIRKVVRYS